MKTKNFSPRAAEIEALKKKWNSSLWSKKKKQKRKEKMKHTILCLSLIAVVALSAFAQTIVFRIGETVETSDGRVCKIISITGRSAKVACGANRSDIRVYSFDSMTSEAAAQAKREQLERQKQNAANQPRPTKVVFNQGDTVTTPDGKTGVIDSFQGEEMAKVRFGANETNYFLLTDLKKPVDSSKPTFRIGDKVFKDGQAGVIEAIEGNGFKVRVGPGKYAFVLALPEQLMTEQQRAEAQEREQREKAQKPIRAQFMDEAQAFSLTIYKLAPIYDAKYDGGGTGITQENRTYEAWRKDLENLDAVCQKFPNMTNPSAMASYYQGDIKLFPADWCKIAAQRTEILQKTKRKVGDSFTETDIRSLMIDVGQSLNDEQGYVNEKVQTFLFDRAAWERALLPAMRKYYLDPNATISPELFKPHEEKIAELKVKIEQDAQTKSWTEPKSRDAASEAAARRKFSADFPGAKILKTGMTDSAWAVMDSKTEVASTNTGWRLYRVNKGAYRYRSGRALIQLPNQPFCQIREFEVTQYKAGAGYGAAKPWVADTGRFVKCQ